MTATSDNETVAVLENGRIAKAKRAFTTRRVPVMDMQTLISGNLRPEPGDLVLARVKKIGYQARIESPEGRRVHLFQDDEIVICYGNRYAPDQFEAIIPDDLGPCNLIAVGGIASREISRHGRMAASTRIIPIGLIGNADGQRLNLRNYAIRPDNANAGIPVVLVAGTSMNAGKTLSAASIVYSLKAAGHRVAAIKATGTGAGGDLWIMRDVAADVVLDFTDGGFASTYKADPDEIETATLGLIGHAAEQGCNIAVIEIADGLQQTESAALLRSRLLRVGCVGVMFASYDALGAKAGVDTLIDMGHRVLAVSGKLTQSTLASREAEELTGLPVYTPSNLRKGALLRKIVAPTNAAHSRQSDVFFIAAKKAIGNFVAPTEQPAALMAEGGAPA